VFGAERAQQPADEMKSESPAEIVHCVASQRWGYVRALDYRGLIRVMRKFEPLLATNNFSPRRHCQISSVAAKTAAAGSDA
jgi:hypothetical protein